MYISRLGLCAAILLLAAPALPQSVDFNTPVNYYAGPNPTMAAVADFNGDGKPDLAVAPDGLPEIMLGNGDGTFQTTTRITESIPAVWLAVGDFNGDGKPDLVVVPGDSSNNAGILLGNGDGTFQNPLIFSAGRNPVCIAVADFNGDGKLDLAIADQSGGSISIWLGKGDGTFLPPAFYAVEKDPNRIAVADFNGDGKLDLAVLSYGESNAISPNNVSILLGNGDGTFQPRKDYGTGEGGVPLDLAVGDFNGDGKPDLAVANSESGTVAILLGNGDGSFQPHVLNKVGKYPDAVVAADFNGDGKVDLAVSYEGGVTAILLGNGDGTFQTPVRYVPGGFTLTVADFNGDGVPDLAVCPLSFSAEGITILLGKGGGVFGPQPASYPVAHQPEFVAVGDFNRDGKADLAVADKNSNTVSILLNNGAGGFQARVDYAVLKQPECVAVGDFNGDGKPDLAVADFGSDAVSILLGNGDGTFRPAVNYELGGSFNPVSVVVADFNGDGKLDLAIGRKGVEVSVLLGNGDGTFQPAVSYSMGSRPSNYFTYVAVGDFNGDGKPDVAAVTNYAIYVLPGNGDGTFGPPVFTGAGDDSFQNQVTVADFNGDGMPDLLFGGLIYLGNGDGTFRYGAYLSSNQTAAVGDFNGDGKLDVAIINFGPIAIFLGDGAGTFSPAGTFFGGDSPGFPAVGDFNGDGKPDLAVANGDGFDNITVLINTSP